MTGSEPDSSIDLTSRYRICRAGFLLGALACGLMAFDAAGHTVTLLTRSDEIGRLVRSNDWMWFAGTAVAWSAVFSSLALTGRWSSPFWVNRTRILVMLSGVGLLLWLMRFGDKFGLFAGELPFPWMRMQLALAFRWFWMLLLAELAHTVAQHLGRDTSRALATTRTLISVGVALWLLLLFTSLRMMVGGGMGLRRGAMVAFWMQWLGFSGSRAAACFAVTLMALLAARDCAALLRELRRSDAWPTASV